MKIVCFSDTHQRHNRLAIPKCDVLIFSGDMCSGGELHQVSNFARWLAKNSDNFDKVIIVAGNHDLCFENMKLAAISELTHHLADKLVYLQDSEYVYKGIKFYGSPWQPRFFNWAFNLNRGVQLESVWELIPEDTNVLITHGPPHGIGDKVSNTHVGCFDLLKRVSKLSNLFLHVYGHIHEGNGHYISEAVPNVNFCNASICDAQYYPTNLGYEFTLTANKEHHSLTCNSVDLKCV